MRVFACFGRLLWMIKGFIMVHGGLGPIGKGFVIFEILFVIFGIVGFFWFWLFKHKK